MAFSCCEQELDRDEVRASGTEKPAGGPSDGPFAIRWPATVSAPVVYSESVRRLAQDMAPRQAEAGIDLSQAQRLLAELKALPADSRRTVVLSEPRFTSCSLADLILSMAEEAVEADPTAAAGTEMVDGAPATPSDLAELALAVTDGLPDRGLPSALVSDLKARAWAVLGDTWAAEGSDRAAQAAFRLARGHLASGSGDPLEEAALLFHEAAPGRAEGYERSLQRLDRAVAIFLEHGDLQRVRRSLRRMGRVLGEADLPCRIQG